MQGGETAEQAAKTLEAQLNSGDKEERIKARRQRIAERVEAAKRSASSGTDGEQSDSTTYATTTSHEPSNAVKQALTKLSTMRMRTDASVAQIVLDAHQSEAQRRKQLNAHCQELHNKVNAEVHKEQHDFEKEEDGNTNPGYDQLVHLHDALEVKESLESAQRASEHIVHSKEQLIDELNKALREQDDAYSRALKQQAEEIDTLISRMGAQYRELESACADELRAVEDAFLRERSEVLDANEKELESLRQRWHNQRQQYQKQLEDRMEEYNNEIVRLRQQDAEDFNILKIRLETDIQNLEQHLEAMRATYQLNTEKLEYNYKVLVERDHENQQTISQQKRKMARQRDALSTLKRRHAEAEQKYSEENQRLTEEYKRTTEQYQDLQIKLKHFKHSDIQRYSDFWRMQEEHVVSLANKVLNADRAITEQLLGLHWHSPPDDVFNSPADTHNGLDLLLEQPSSSQRSSQAQEEGGTGAAEPESQEQQGRRSASRAAALLDDDDNAELVQLLCDEAGFLVESRVQRACEELGEDERQRVKVKAILQALGVTSSRSLEALQEALAPSGDLVTPDQVVPALRIVLKQLSESQASTSGKQNVQKQRQDHQQFESPQLQQSAMPKSSKAQRAKQRKDFWDNLAEVVDARGERVWASLHRALEKYSDMLGRRSEEVSRVEQLQQQNNELRSLLSSYVSSSINNHLQVPPSADLL